MESPQVFRFEAVLDRFPGKGGYYFLDFPYNVEEFFGERGTLRMLGVINGVSVNRALMPRGDGSHYIILGTELRRQTRLKLGDRAQIEIWREPAADELDIPEELTAALNLEPAALEKFENFKPGMKRNICYWINSAKRAETRAQRAAEVLRRILSGEFHFGGTAAKD